MTGYSGRFNFSIAYTQYVQTMIELHNNLSRVAEGTLMDNNPILMIANPFVPPGMGFGEHTKVSQGKKESLPEFARRSKTNVANCIPHIHK